MDRNEAIRIVEETAGAKQGTPGYENLIKQFGSPEGVVSYWRSMGVSAKAPAQPAAPNALELAKSGKFEDWRNAITSAAPQDPREAVGVWQDQMQSLEGEMYRGENNGQVMQMLQEAKRREAEARQATADADIGEAAARPAGKPAPKKPFEGVSEMVHSAEQSRRKYGK